MDTKSLMNRGRDLAAAMIKSAVVPDLEPGTVVRVEKCRDRVLVGAEGKVVGVVRDSAAAVARVYVEPRRLG